LLCPYRDPEDNVEFAKLLYINDDFTESLFNALTDQGVLVMQLGITPTLKNVPEELGKLQVRESLEKDLVRFGFQSIHQYDEVSLCRVDLYRRVNIYFYISF